MDKSRILKSVFLIVGTSIGTGILALPTATAAGGLINALITLSICFIFMTLGAFYVTEVALKLPKSADFMTMARVTLGPIGQYSTAVTYTLLLYALTAMYLLVGSSWFVQSLMESHAIKLDKNVALLIFTVCLIPFVAQGMRAVGRLNQLMTIALLIVFSALLAGTMTIISPENMMDSGNLLDNLPAIPLVITSFGFSIVMPTLTTYLHKDKHMLFLTLIIGSLVTFGAYILWEISGFGVLGPARLRDLATQADNGTLLVLALEAHSPFAWIGQAARFFVIFAVISSVLGVTLSLCNFFKDALKLKETWGDRTKSILMTFTPPIFLLIIHPMGLGYILSLAGLFVAILLGILPALMAYNSRKQYPQNTLQTPGGTSLISLSILFFIYVVFQEILNIITP